MQVVVSHLTISTLNSKLNFNLFSSPLSDYANPCKSFSLNFQFEYTKKNRVDLKGISFTLHLLHELHKIHVSYAVVCIQELARFLLHLFIESMLNSINRQIFYRTTTRNIFYRSMHVRSFLSIHIESRTKNNNFVLDDEFIVQFSLAKSHERVFDLCNRLLKQAFY